MWTLDALLQYWNIPTVLKMERLVRDPRLMTALCGFATRTAVSQPSGVCFRVILLNVGEFQSVKYILSDCVQVFLYGIA